MDTGSNDLLFNGLMIFLGSVLLYGIHSGRLRELLQPPSNGRSR